MSQRTVHRSATAPGGSARAVVFLAAIYLSGCTFTETIEAPVLPVALVEPLPIKVGVYFGDEFKCYQYTTLVIPGEESVKVEINFDSSNVDLFEQVFAQSFESIVLIDEWPFRHSARTDLDALIRPTISELRSTPDIVSQGGPHVYSKIAYTFELVEPDGRQIVSWTIADATDVKPPSFEGSIASFQAKVIEEQMRLIAAKFLIGFREQAEVREWLKRNQLE